MCSTQHGKQRGYFVEVRVPPDGGIVGGRSFSAKWTRMEFKKGERGIPVRIGMNSLGTDNGLLTYEAAMALMAWEATICDYATEFRLVEVELEYDWKITERGVGPAINFDAAESDLRAALVDRNPTPDSEVPEPRLQPDPASHRSEEEPR